jgi:hypothetical protein
MSTQMASLPVGPSAGTARSPRSAERPDAQETTARGHRGKRAPRAEHRPCGKPQGYLCTCGRLREVCVRDRVRALWA